MSIARNTSADLAVQIGTATTYTRSYTCGSGSERCLVVSFWGDQDITAITSITYAGVSMTSIADGIGGSGTRRIFMYQLVNPASGANNIVITFPTGQFAIKAQCSDYTGVDQSTPVDTSGTAVNDPAASPISKNITITAADCWVVGGARNVLGSVAWTNLTELQDSADGISIADTNAGVTGSFTGTVTAASADISGLILVALKPSGGGGGTPLFRVPLLNGLGSGGPLFNNPLG